MAGQRTIVGIGEAALAERGDRGEPVGLACSVAMAALRLGQRGVAVARIGQDRVGDDLLELLRGAGVETTHIQTDPDLPTARHVVRAIGPAGPPVFPPHIAFDNLQWDFDLVDLAHETDAVVFGLLASREGQTCSVIYQYLCECTAALKLVDLTNRPAEAIDRAACDTIIGAADVAVADRDALRALVPGGGDRPPAEAMANLVRQFDLALGVHVEPGDRGLALTAYDGSDDWPAPRPLRPEAQTIALVSLLHALQAGSDVPGALRHASRIADWSADHPDEPIPDAVRSGD